MFAHIRPHAHQNQHASVHPCIWGGDSGRCSDGSGQIRRRTATLLPPIFVFGTPAVAEFMVLMVLHQPMAASANHKRLHNNQIGGESDF